MACQHSNGHFILPDHPRLYLKVGDFATTPLQACTGTTSFLYKHLPCYKACSSTSVEMEAGLWEGELTLAQPWRFHTLKGLSQDCIAHWTDSNEAEFRDGMYHSGSSGACS